MRRLSAILLSATLAIAGSEAAAETLIPEKRFVLSQDADLPGGDLTSIFDTTLEACERACLASDDCTAFTFNTRNGSCFPKADPGAEEFFQGAFSGRVLAADPAIVAAAPARRAEIGFVQDWEMASALNQATTLADAHITGPFAAEDHLQAALDAENAGDVVGAAQFAGAALNLTDDPATWAEYARLNLAGGRADASNASFYFDRAYMASINGFLRAENPALQHTLLVTMGEALEQVGRGRDTVQALRLAQSLQPRDDTALYLDDAIGKYGFRIIENTVESDLAQPRLCATFSEDLQTKGVDLSTFVKLPEAGLTVAANGTRQLCVEGVAHGARYAVTFREGLPAVDGQVLAKSVDLTVYVRDRNPGVRFPGRGYVLPATGSATLPVTTVNTDKLDLTLYRVSDRNMLRAIQDAYFGAPMPDYLESLFTEQVGEKLWTGAATVGQEVNRDVTTRLPLDEAIAGQPAGIYALKAAVPGVDPYVVPASWQWFVVTDLGLTTMSGTDGLHVFVRGLGDAGARPGVTVELLSRANAALGTATTDAMGYARFDAGLTRGTGGAAPAMVVARAGETDLAFLSLTDPAFDLSDRGVEGREAAPPVDVFLTTDRGAYRAGETVYATALARDAGAAAVEGLPLTAILKRPDGIEASRALMADAGAGGHVFALPVAGNAQRGVWRIEVLADLDAAPLASRTFLVEDFLPERIDFDLALPEGPVRLGDAPEATLAARYLFGAPGADLAIEGETLLRAAEAVPGFDSYVFGQWDAPFSATLEPIVAGRTQEDGTAIVPITLPAVDDPGRPVEARITLRVAEGSGRPVERAETLAIAPSGPVIGVRPLFDGAVAEGAEARFSVVAVGPDLTAVALPVAWEIVRIETDYQWYQSFGNWNWEPITRRSRVAEGRLDLGAGPAEFAAPVSWGQYELVVTAEGGTALTSTPFDAGWYAAADAATTPDTLEVSLDKPAYAAGDTATLRVVPREAGMALVTVLSNRLVAMQAVEVTAGENLIALPVTADWGAGVYVTVSALRPMDAAAGRNPARALGLAHAAIDPGAKALAVAVETPAEAAPRGPLDIAVKVSGMAAGETAYVTIAAVDQGILNLTAFDPPDPQGHYFGQRKLGVGIRDVYGRLIDGLNGAEGAVRSGGDAGAQARLQAPPPTEELVAYFTGPVTVGADGYARTSFDLPSFNGTVKVMAVAWTRSGVGQADADVLVRDPVVVTASVPRFLSPGDTSRVLLEIVHATGPSGRMGLDVSSTGLTLGQAPSGLDLADRGKAVIEVPLTAGAEGVQTIAIALTTPDGKQLTKTLTVPVQANDPPVTQVSRLDLLPGQSFSFDANAFAGLKPGSARATLAVGPIARLNAPGLLAALDRYPYGCTEQITARALPLLYLDEVAVAMGIAGDDAIAGRIDEAVAAVLANQAAEGGFGLWGPGSGDLWLDAFVTDFLSRARAQGYAVPDAAFRNALGNLRNQVNYAADFDFGGEGLAYALMVLAREGAAAIGDLRYYADVKGDAFATPVAQAQVGAALAAYGDQPRADAMFRKAATTLAALPAGRETEQVWRADYGSIHRDAAAVLTLAAEAGSTAVDREALASRLATAGALSTQEATWTLMAASALIDRPGADGITVDGQPASGAIIRVLDREATTPVVIANGSGVATTVTVTSLGVPEVPAGAGGQGYAITRSYYTLEGEAVTLDNVAVGTRLVTVLEVTPFGRGEARLMVRDPLPAGLEIDNPNLIAGGSVAALDWLQLESGVSHTEARQDAYLAALDRLGPEPFRLAYIVRAVSPGTFHHPAASVEDMYRPDFRAQSETGRVTIAP